MLENRFFIQVGFRAKRSRSGGRAAGEIQSEEAEAIEKKHEKEHNKYLDPY